jgi:hypothetical protein
MVDQRRKWETGAGSEEVFKYVPFDGERCANGAVIRFWRFNGANGSLVDKNPSCTLKRSQKTMQKAGNGVKHRISKVCFFVFF